MYVRSQFQGQGLSRRLLDHLQDYAREQRVPLLRLETGIHQKEAIGLYERFGFYKIRPFWRLQGKSSYFFFEKKV